MSFAFKAYCTLGLKYLSYKYLPSKSLQLFTFLAKLEGDI